MGKKNRNTKTNAMLSTTGEKIRFALGDVGCNLIWGFVGSYLTMYYTDSILISAASAGTIIMIARLLDGLSDVLMGFIIEKTKSKWGKARPWLLWMAIPLALSFIFTFHVPAQLTGTAKILYVAITYTLMSAGTYPALIMAYITLFTLFAPDSKDRNTATSYRTLFAMITGVVVGMISMPLLESFGGIKNQAAWDKVTILYSVIVSPVPSGSFPREVRKMLPNRAVTRMMSTAAAPPDSNTWNNALDPVNAAFTVSPIFRMPVPAYSPAYPSPLPIDVTLLWRMR